MKSLKGLGEPSIPGHCNNDVNPYERTSMEWKYVGGEGRTVGTEGGQHLPRRKRATGFLFQVQDSFVSCTEGLFSFAVCHLACLSRPPPSFLLSPFPLFSTPVCFRGCFSLGGINGRGSSQRPLQSNPDVARKSRARGRFEERGIRGNA